MAAPFALSLPSFSASFAAFFILQQTRSAPVFVRFYSFATGPLWDIDCRNDAEMLPIWFVMRGEQEMPIRHLITLCSCDQVSTDDILGLPEKLPYGLSKTRIR